MLSITCLCASAYLPVIAEQTALDEPFLEQPLENGIDTITDNLDAAPDTASESLPQAPAATEPAAPHPPVIDTQPETLYEPVNTTDIDTASTKDEADTATASDETHTEDIPEPASLPTPVPPVIDVQQEPVYSLEQKQAQEQLTVEADSDSDTITSEESTAETKPEASKETTRWSDTRPVKVNADWLQLTTGEWLRGRIIIMQKDDLEFDSDELKVLVIEWKKVRYLKSYEPYSMRFDGRVQVVGNIEVTQDKVHVSSDYDDQTFERSELQTIASGKESEISYWTNKVTFSINVRRGNTDQTDFTSKISAKRRTIDSRLLIDYLGNFTEVEDSRTVNNHRLNSNFDIFITRDLFFTPITGEYYRDPFQNIERRLNAGISLGYTIINTSESEWDISGGPAYQKTRFVSVQAGEPNTDSTATLGLGTRFDTELNDKVDLEGTYSVTLGDDKAGNYNHHAILTIETELTDKLDFDVSTVWDRVKSPVADATGEVPEKDDFRIMIGLGYDL